MTTMYDIGEKVRLKKWDEVSLHWGVPKHIWELFDVEHISSIRYDRFFKYQLIHDGLEYWFPEEVLEPISDVKE